MQKIMQIPENQITACIDNGELTDIIPKFYEDLSKGFIYTHNRIHENTKKSLEVASFLYGLIELLSEKEMISISELEHRKKQVAEQLINKFVSTGIGLMYQEPEYDKYHFEHKAQVDCQDCLHVCRAICCKFPFALSRQDVEEGIIRWQFGRPY